MCINMRCCARLYSAHVPASIQYALELGLAHAEPRVKSPKKGPAAAGCLGPHHGPLVKSLAHEQRFVHAIRASFAQDVHRVLHKIELQSSSVLGGHNGHVDLYRHSELHTCNCVKLCLLLSMTLNACSLPVLSPRNLSRWKGQRLLW